MFFPLELNVKGHTVIAPIKHCADLFDIEANMLSSLISTTQLMAKHLKRQLGADGINLLHASGKAAQQSVLHFHVHLLPRFENDNLDAWPSLPEWSGDLDELLIALKVDERIT